MKNNLIKFFRKLLKKKTSKRHLSIDEVYLKSYSLTESEKEILNTLVILINYLLLDSIDNYVLDANTDFPKRLKKNKLYSNILKVEFLALVLCHIGNELKNENYNKDIYSIIHNKINDLIDKFSLPIPNDDFQNKEEYFQNRLSLYSKFFYRYFSTDRKESLKQYLFPILFFNDCVKKDPEIIFKQLPALVPDFLSHAEFQLFFDTSFEEFLSGISKLMKGIYFIEE